MDKHIDRKRLLFANHMGLQPHQTPTSIGICKHFTQVEHQCTASNFGYSADNIMHNRKHVLEQMKAMITPNSTLTKEHRTVLAVIVFGLWISVIVSGFWWFELRLIRPFLDNLALFDGQHLDLNYRPETGAITLMHFGDPNCPCNQFNTPHLEEIKNHYQPKGVNFVAWQQGSDIPPVKGFDALHNTPQLTFIPATPSVAIWSREGKLSYFGPYSSGLLCSLGEGFAETVLDQLQAGLSPQVINTTGVGCFCPTLPQTT